MMGDKPEEFDHIAYIHATDRGLTIDQIEKTLRNVNDYLHGGAKLQSITPAAIGGKAIILLHVKVTEAFLVANKLKEE